jgi:hypothetical protein
MLLLLLLSLCPRLCRHLHLLATRRLLIMVRASHLRVRSNKTLPDPAAAAAAAFAGLHKDGVLPLVW